MMSIGGPGRPFRVFAVVSACGLMLTACGGGDNSSSEPADTVTETVTESPTASSEPAETSSPNGEDDDQDGGGAAAGLPPKPRRDECVEVKTPRDGRYTVYNAGTAVVLRDGGQLRIGNVNAARGWRARVTERGGDDDVKIEFRPRKRVAELELEVEIDDGRIESKICVDDRDDDRDD